MITQILNIRGTQIGKISKQWSGLAREFFLDSDYFGIKFPTDLDVYTKATLLGACMLIVKIQIKCNYRHFVRFFLIIIKTKKRVSIFRTPSFIRNRTSCYIQMFWFVARVTKVNKVIISTSETNEFWFHHFKNTDLNEFKIPWPFSRLPVSWNVRNPC